ncbi:MAG: hypothetical protein IJ521_00365 [Schwartzia sp.]|mgnify:CR=1 FL=1|nr:hypothetical protein [Schwartzia sp. (in: firmicutes)]
MVKLKNINKCGDYVTFDGYINNHPNEDFFMTINLTDDSKSTCSIKNNYYTEMATLKIFRVLAENGTLPREMTVMSH